MMLRHRIRGEEREVQACEHLANQHGLPLLATNGVLYSKPEGRALQDVFTCLRHHTRLDEAGRLLSLNAERQLKTAEEMKSLFHDLPKAVSNSLRLAEQLDFTLADLGYRFPDYP